MRLQATCAALAAAFATLATAGAASAQDVDIAFNAAITSDYVFRGVSQTTEEPAVQIGVDLTSGGFYVGAWASNVDFGDETDAEFDIYGGYRTEAAGFALDLGILGYGYVDAPSVPDADYGYVEFKAAASRAIGPVTAGAVVYFSPEFFRPDEEGPKLQSTHAFRPAQKGAGPGPPATWPRGERQGDGTRRGGRRARRQWRSRERQGAPRRAAGTPRRRRP